MEGKNIVSKDLIKDLKNMTHKEIEDLTEEDFNHIQRINWNGLNIDGTKKDYQVKDLLNFKNLKVLCFSQFVLPQDDFDILHTLQHLNFLSFDFCQFHTEEFRLPANVETFSFNVCHSLQPSMLKNAKIKELQIVGSMVNRQEIDVAGFEQLANIEKIALNRFQIKNINQITQIAPHLRFLNVDGSKLDTKWDAISYPWINVSHKEEFHRANA